MTLFNAQGFGECLPHAILPLEVVLFHALVIVTLAALADTSSTHASQVFVNLSRDQVVVLVRLVTQPEKNVFEILQPVRALAELERVLVQVLQKSDGVICGLTFAIASHDEDSGGAFRKTV